MGTAAHDTARSARRWGWGILLSTGAISLTFNVAHAVMAMPHNGPDGRAHIALAVLYGLTPVLVALALSHLIAIQQGGPGKRILTALVFIAAMGLSVSAIAEVVAPIAGRWKLVFPLMLDVASLLALNEVLSAAGRVEDAVPNTVSTVRPDAVLQPSHDPIPGAVLDRPETPVPALPQPSPSHQQDSRPEHPNTPSRDAHEMDGGDGPEPGQDVRTAVSSKRPEPRPGRRPESRPGKRPAPSSGRSGMTVPALISKLRDDYPGTTGDTVPGIGQIKTKYGVGDEKARAAQAVLKDERDGQPDTAETPPPTRPHLVPVWDEDRKEASQ